MRAPSAGTYRTDLNDGHVVETIVRDVPAPMLLDRWNLTVDSWEPGIASTDSMHVVHELEVAASPMTKKLPAWSELPELTWVSGIGTYTTAVVLGPPWAGGHGAYIDLGTVLDTVSIVVNGARIRPVNLLNTGLIDLGPHLDEGRNTIVIHVATNLNNRVCLAKPDYVVNSALQEYGLIGPVTLRPYGQALLSSHPWSEE